MNSSSNNNNNPFRRFGSEVLQASLWLVIDLAYTINRKTPAREQPRPANVYTLRPRARRAPAS